MMIWNSLCVLFGLATILKSAYNYSRQRQHRLRIIVNAAADVILILTIWWKVVYVIFGFVIYTILITIHSLFFRRDILKCLVVSDKLSYGKEHNQRMDNKYLTMLIGLRKKGLIKKEDIRGQILVQMLCCCEYFAAKRFQFLVEWDPSSLLQTNDNNGALPLHHAATYSSVEGFMTVFVYGMLYYPNKKGISLLFKKMIVGHHTPFQIACMRFGRDEVINIVETTLCSSTTVLPNITQAIMLAANDEHVHLEGVYFLLRRKPDVLIGLLPLSIGLMNNNYKNNINDDESDYDRLKSNRDNSDSNENDDDNDTSNHNDHGSNYYNSQNNDNVVLVDDYVDQNNSNNNNNLYDTHNDNYNNDRDDDDDDAVPIAHVHVTVNVNMHANNNNNNNKNRKRKREESS